MGSPIEYPDVDEALKEWLKRADRWQQVQYSTRDQLLYLIDIAHKFGLYDAADVLKKLIGLRERLGVLGEKENSKEG